MIEEQPSPKPRIEALDFLRGLAIFLMALSGLQPYGNLPGWMYHAQVPPPNHEFNPNLPGITWVDLVFPFFLFAMGAAIPFGLKSVKGNPWYQTLGKVTFRFAALFMFALVCQQLRTGSVGNNHWLALISLAAIVAAYFFSPKFSQNICRAVNLAGTIGIVFIFAFLTNYGVKPFNFQTFDIILLVLAYCSFAASIIWYLTSQNLAARWGIWAVVAGFFVASKEPGIAQTIWYFEPLGPIFSPSYLKYLLIIIPGSIVGDSLLAGSPIISNTAKKFATVTFSFFLVVGLTVGLYMRALEVTTLIAIVATISLMIAFAMQSQTEQSASRIVNLAGFLVILGLIFEPFEGGIKKDNATLSYLLLTTGMAAFLLLALAQLQKALVFPLFRWVSLAGANPILSYALITNFSVSGFAVIGLHQWVNDMTLNPWQRFAFAVGRTILVCLLAAWASKAKFYLRA